MYKVTFPEFKALRLLFTKIFLQKSFLKLCDYLEYSLCSYVEINYVIIPPLNIVESLVLEAKYFYFLIKLTLYS